MKTIETLVPDSDEDAFAVAIANVIGIYISGQDRADKSSWRVQLTYSKIDQLLQAFFLFGYYSKTGIYGHD